MHTIQITGNTVKNLKRRSHNRWHSHTCFQKIYQTGTSIFFLLTLSNLRMSVVPRGSIVHAPPRSVYAGMPVRRYASGTPVRSILAVSTRSRLARLCWTTPEVCGWHNSFCRSFEIFDTILFLRVSEFWYSFFFFVLFCIVLCQICCENWISWLRELYFEMEFEIEIFWSSNNR